MLLSLLDLISRIPFDFSPAIKRIHKKYVYETPVFVKRLAQIIQVHASIKIDYRKKKNMRISFSTKNQANFVRSLEEIVAKTLPTLKLSPGLKSRIHQRFQSFLRAPDEKHLKSKKIRMQKHRYNSIKRLKSSRIKAARARKPIDIRSKKSAFVKKRAGGPLENPRKRQILKVSPPNLPKKEQTKIEKGAVKKFRRVLANLRSISAVICEKEHVLEPKDFVRLQKKMKRGKVSLDVLKKSLGLILGASASLSKAEKAHPSYSKTVAFLNNQLKLLSA